MIPRKCHAKRNCIAPKMLHFHHCMVGNVSNCQCICLQAIFDWSISRHRRSLNIFFSEFNLDYTLDKKRLAFIITVDDKTITAAIDNQSKIMCLYFRGNRSGRRKEKRKKTTGLIKEMKNLVDINTKEEEDDEYFI